VRELARRLGGAPQFAGVDAAAAMIEQAQALAGKQLPSARLAFVRGVAERLPFGNGAFDLVASTTSFDHWADQRAGLAECRRVLAPGGVFVLADLCSPWLGPPPVGARPGRGPAPPRATRPVAAGGVPAAPGAPPLAGGLTP